MQNIASYTSLTFSVNFDKYHKQINKLPYMIGTTIYSINLTPVSVAGIQITLTYNENLDIKRFIKTSPPYFIDKLDTTYTDTNLNVNHIFYNFSENLTEKNVPYGGFYFKNTLTANDDILDDNFNGIGYYSRVPDVNYNSKILFNCINKSFIKFLVPRFYSY